MVESKHNDHEKKSAMRTSRDVYNRLRWDYSQHQIGSNSSIASSSQAASSNIAPTTVNWTIGFEDRFLGMQEMPVEQFIPPEAGGEIPWHR